MTHMIEHTTDKTPPADVSAGDPMNTTDITPIASRKFTNEEIYDLCYDNYRIGLQDERIDRVLKIANKKYSSVTDQMTAVGMAIDAEVEAMPKKADAVYRLRAMAPPDNLIIDYPAEGTHPWFEDRRPAWSDPECDLLDVADSTGFASSQWRSEVFSLPSRRYYGKTEHGTHRLARLNVALVQALNNAAPYITFERGNWTRSGKPEPASIRHQFELDEAVTFAHMLLNLVDLANEADSNAK